MDSSLLNNKEITSKVTTRKKKRVINGKRKISEQTSIYLTPKQELLIYLEKFNEDHYKLDHKFLVRGFYRSFKDKERYNPII